MKKQDIKIHLDEDLMEWIREKAKWDRCSVSQAIRTLIAEAMRRERDGSGRTNG